MGEGQEAARKKIHVLALLSQGTGALTAHQVIISHT